MKKMKYLLCVIGVALFLAGCGEDKSSQNNAESPQYADEKFVEDMSKGLQARWDLNEEEEQKEGYEDILVNSDEYKELMLSFIDAELDCIEEYKDEKFEDSNLQESAIKYINLLKQHKEICDYLTVDYEEYAKEFEPIYNERSKVIKEMVDKYGMVVDEEHQDTLNEFLANSKLVEKKEMAEEAINTMLDGVQFQAVTDNGGGYKTYQAVMENTTGIDFKSFSVSINLINADGVIVETTYDQISAFANGTKAQLEFMTDKEFSSTQVISDWWE